MTTIKIKLGEDLRRVTLYNKPSFAELQNLISTLFTLAYNDFSFKYADDEDDLITITQERELEEAWNYAQNASPPVLRITVVKKDKEAAKAAPASNVDTNNTASNNSNIKVDTNANANANTNKNPAACLASLSSEFGPIIQQLVQTYASSKDGSGNQNQADILGSILTPQLIGQLLSSGILTGNGSGGNNNNMVTLLSTILTPQMINQFLQKPNNNNTGNQNQGAPLVSILTSLLTPPANGNANTNATNTNTNGNANNNNNNNNAPNLSNLAPLINQFLQPEVINSVLPVIQQALQPQNTGSQTSTPVNDNKTQAAPTTTAPSTDNVSFVVDNDDSQQMSDAVQKLKDMGFDDSPTVRQLLRKHNFNVVFVINELIAGTQCD